MNSRRINAAPRHRPVSSRLMCSAVNDSGWRCIPAYTDRRSGSGRKPLLTLWLSDSAPKVDPLSSSRRGDVPDRPVFRSTILDCWELGTGVQADTRMMCGTNLPYSFTPTFQPPRFLPPEEEGRPRAGFALGPRRRFARLSGPLFLRHGGKLSLRP